LLGRIKKTKKRIADYFLFYKAFVSSAFVSRRLFKKSRLDKFFFKKAFKKYSKNAVL